jgi:hypothetical protein
VQSNGSLNLAGFNAGRANFHALDCLADKGSYWLQIGHPASLVMRVVVRTQKGVIHPGHGAFITYVAALCHNFGSDNSREKTLYTIYEYRWVRIR